jgi:hypothetical protein
MVINGSPYDKVSVMNFTVKDPTYASRGVISGSKSLYKEKEYRYRLSLETFGGVAPIGSYDVVWSLAGEGVSSYVSNYGADPDDKLSFVMSMNSNQPDDSEVSSQMTISARVVNHDGSVVNAQLSVLALN